MGSAAASVALRGSGGLLLLGGTLCFGLLGALGLLGGAVAASVLGVLLIAVVGDVEAGALEDDPDREEDSPQRSAARLASRERRVGDLLERLDTRATSATFVF